MLQALRERSPILCPTARDIVPVRGKSPKCDGVGYRRLEGRRLAYETEQTCGHEKASLTVRIQPSACTLARWQAILFPERNCLGTLPENALLGASSHDLSADLENTA
jgi:hypothetical protein